MAVPRFDRYLMAQLMAHFGFFALVLVAVYWINRAVVLFDKLMSDGHSALVFVELSLLSLPNVIRLVLPFAGFVASVFVANKLISESELVVMQATGFSPLRMARPVLYFGLVVALMMGALVNLLVPLSREQMVTQRAALAENITSRFLTEGQFTHPSHNVTFYVNQIDASGQLRDVFLEDEQRADQTTTYTARRALFVKGDSGPKLIMLNGMAQTLDRESLRLSVTRFTDFTYDLGGLFVASGGHQRGLTEIASGELLSNRERVLAETGASPQELTYEINSRIAEPFLAASVVLIGFACLLLGGFSRLGLWRQIGFAAVLLVVVQGVVTVAPQLGQSLSQGWILAYAAPVTGMAIAGMLLWVAGRPHSGRTGRGSAVLGVA
ncbi:MAG: LPS export ABC transporter permease LptF [Alphaproteobacteria bacterium]